MSTSHDILHSELFIRNDDLPGGRLQAHRMHQAGVLERISPGVYLGSEVGHHPLAESAAWASRHGHVVVGLLSAAVFYDLVDAFAGGIWFLVPRGGTRPRSSIASIHVVQVKPELLEPDNDPLNGIEPIDVHGTTTRVTNADRTVADLWRYAHLIPEEHALIALKRRALASDFSRARFARLARRVGSWSRIAPVLQGITL